MVDMIGLLVEGRNDEAFSILYNHYSNENSKSANPMSDPYVMYSAKQDFEYFKETVAGLKGLDNNANDNSISSSMD